MAKILMINPVVREEDVPRHVPYGIALLASIAMDNGHLVQIYDANAWRQNEDVHREVLVSDDWDVVAMGGITTAYRSVKDLVGLARELCPDTLIVVGGGVLTSLPKEMMGWLPEVDVGVIGEAFETFPEILSRVDAGNSDWGEIPGTISRKADGGLMVSPQRKLIEELDVLPYPAWDLFPLEEVYFKNSKVLFSEEGMLASRRLDINASYGCSLVCRYCFHLGISGDMRYENTGNGDFKIAFDEPGNYSRNIRYHSPEYIVKLIKHAYDKYDINFIGFLDENLMTMDRFSKKVWIKEICRLLHEFDLAPTNNPDGTWSGIHWSGTSHASLCYPEILKVMRKAGCSHLVYGYESFAPHVMRKIGKGVTPKHNIESFFWTLDAGIRPIPNQIIGFPNEDFNSIRQNMEAWKKLGIVVKPFFATPYPGSEWFSVYKDSILEQFDGDLEQYILELGDATKITAVISHNFNAVELLGLREMMLNFDYRRINDYEKQWREHHHIEPEAPSTVYTD